MGRFVPRYAQEQKDAVVISVCDHKRTVPATLKLAAAGQLPHPANPDKTLEPFEITTSTAYTITQREKRKRHGQEWRAKRASLSLEDRATAIGEQAVAILEHNVDRRFSDPKRDLTDDEARTLKMMIDAARSAKALAKGQAPNTYGSTARRTAEADRATTPDEDGLLGTLAGRKPTTDPSLDRGVLAYTSKPKQDAEPAPIAA